MLEVRKLCRVTGGRESCAIIGVAFVTNTLAVGEKVVVSVSARYMPKSFENDVRKAICHS